MKVTANLNLSVTITPNERTAAIWTAHLDECGITDPLPIPNRMPIWDWANIFGPHLGGSSPLPHHTSMVFEAAEVADGGGWQPIKTAPKERDANGNSIYILLVGGFLTYPERDDPREYPYNRPHIACWLEDSGYWLSTEGGDEDIAINEPTHWMPLPSPPKEEGS
jgi:hypothetical protein